MTEEEAQLFRRSSRVFVTDLGRSIPTRVKYSLAKDHPGQKVHYQEARSLIYESDLHLDAVGEHPRYLKLRRLRAGNYAAKLQAVRKLRLLMGFVRRGTLQRLYEQSLLQPGPDRVWKLVCAMEATLPAAALRSGLAHDVLASRVMGERGVFYVNGVRPLQPRAMFVQPGDVIGPGPWAADWHRRYVASQLGRRLLAAAEASWAGGDGSDAAVPEAPAGRDSRSVPTAF